ADFADGCGRAIEGVSGSQPASYTERCVGWARRFGLHGSCGSDFHSPRGRRPLPGGQGPWPEGLPHVLELLG
ncbi:MAG: hypothetical protein HUK26_09405, partial [Duodenibacillus sp.]|nr:hypothetical protein [Duodenibacillus sp.]